MVIEVIKIPANSSGVAKKIILTYEGENRTKIFSFLVMVVFFGNAVVLLCVALTYLSDNVSYVCGDNVCEITQLSLMYSTFGIYVYHKSTIVCCNLIRVIWAFRYFLFEDRKLMLANSVQM